ncbi:hypothetical protein DL96DRAFT_1600073 [Flagelloscypha sp. PMI_526]|nr:hypothetical protein DL96DRAFT_1600073 [Flagelloscypha sp. PMI_526]
MDEATLLLITQLSLEDVEDFGFSRKGKSKEGAPLSDGEVALQLQEALLQETQQILLDHAFCLSVDHALDTDQRLVQVLAIQEQAAQDDRAFAEALSLDSQPPAVSVAQRQVEREQTDVIQSRSIAASLRVSNPPTFRQGSSNETPGKSERAGPCEECIACGDIVGRATFIRGPCNHIYCKDCFEDLASSSLNDESLHPLRCCNKPFDREQILSFLTSCLSQSFEAKAREFDIVPNNRLYCPSPSCSIFLRSVEDHGSDFACKQCFTMVCPLCKQRSHFNETCTENTAIAQIRELAREHGWQTCPRCQQVVELAHGCYHMTCRCRTEFCYVCAAPWKTCDCPQWDEQRLEAVAERRVVEEFGLQARQQPAVFQQRVQRQTAHLRENHDCVWHSWKSCGPGQCEECYNIMPYFLRVCRNCSMRACTRCTRNRLA